MLMQKKHDDYETILCEIMERHGSDKGGSKRRSIHGHNYTIKYHDLFKGLRNEKLNVFELGLGTNQSDYHNNSNVEGIPGALPGASLRGWREYFPNADIYGADIDKRILFQEDKIKTFYCDQLNPDVIAEMWKSLDLEFDIIIEDGLHTFEANVCFLRHSLKVLKSSGFYVVEDINGNELKNWYSVFDEIKKEYPKADCKMYCLQYDQNRGNDNNIVVIKKISSSKIL